ncbi:hypothetical protein [Thermaerobacillus caldiproteolyticus]|nr:hypothetical protein [Anoxybacillus caldiproteolyticus]
MGKQRQRKQQVAFEQKEGKSAETGEKKQKKIITGRIPTSSYGIRKSKR